jgi:hypothetical protein
VFRDYGIGNTDAERALRYQLAESRARIRVYAGEDRP